MTELPPEPIPGQMELPLDPEPTDIYADVEPECWICDGPCTVWGSDDEEDCD